MAETTLPVAQIKSWATFHALSAEAFGFPNFYGHNNDAWIDCLTYLTDGDGMSKFVLSGDERLFINLPRFVEFLRDYPDISSGFLDCVAAVNSRYLEQGDIPRLVLVPL